MGSERGNAQAGDGWQRVDEAFSSALERAPAEREAWVRTAYADAPDIRDAVLDLLADDPSSERFFRAAERARDSLAAEAAREDGVDLVGRRIGPYRLQALIATGGMGAVYRAERDDGAFRQTVAIKILPAWATDAQTVARLRAERQILSGLQHPGITRLLDGGRTGDGFPYLVTEFIDGVSIVDWVESQGLELEARLRLFLRVADAVQHAHEQGVLHRDIKPANVLVDRSGRPHLLDFGIAKLLEDAALPVTMARTATGLTPMTPEYASPEQRAGEAVGVASDVYQLGLLLFRLLTGQRFAVDDSVRTGFVTRPSAAVGTPGEGRDAPGLDPARLARALRGDLDTIVLKALRSDPAERYRSVRALARDLRHHLAGEAIEARQETLWAASRRLARHYPVAATLALSLVAVLLVGVASLSFYAQALDRQRQEAERQATRAGQVRDVLIDIFRRTDTLQADAVGGPAASVWASLDAAAEAARAELDDDPEVLAELLGTLSVLQGYAGEERKARELLEESRALYRALGPDFRGEYLVQTAELARRLVDAEKERSRDLFAEVYAGLPDLRRERPTLAVQALMDVGIAKESTGEYGASIDALDRALALLDRPGANDWSSRVEAHFVRGNALTDLGRLDEAALDLERALALTRMHFGDDHDRLTGTLSALSGLERLRDNSSAAIAWAEQLVEMMARTRAPTYGGLLSARNNLALAYDRAGRHDEAQETLRELIAIRRDNAGPEGDRALAGALKNLASSLYVTGRLAEAREAVLEARALMERHYPAGSPIVASAWFTLGQVDIDSGEPAAAQEAFETALRIIEPTLGPGHVQAHVVRCHLAEALWRQGDREGARQLAGPALEGIATAEIRYPAYLERCQTTVRALEARRSGAES